jgi:hypothetical protein
MLTAALWLTLGGAASAVLYGMAALVVTAPFVTFAALLRLGHNWVRILLTVCLSIGGVQAVWLIFPFVVNDSAVVHLLALVPLATSGTVMVQPARTVTSPAGCGGFRGCARGCSGPRA